VIDTFEAWWVIPRIGSTVRHWPTDRRGEVLAAIGGVCAVRIDGREEVLADDLLVVTVSEDLSRE